MYEFIGYIGGFFYAICYFPQIHDIFKKGTTKLNNIFLLMQFFGAICMIVYSTYNFLMPIFCLNIIALISIIVIYFGVRRFENLPPQIPSQ